MPKNFYISDLHLGHGNVIRFDGRPFGDVAEMEQALISNWNSRVGRDDTVYILGDFIWGKEPEWRRLVPLFAGNKVLIRGNHDLKSMSRDVRNLFQDVKDYKEITDDGRHVILCHYPMLFYKSAYNPLCYMHINPTTTPIDNFHSPTLPQKLSRRALLKAIILLYVLYCRLAGTICGSTGEQNQFHARAHSGKKSRSCAVHLYFTMLLCLLHLVFIHRGASM